MLFANLCLTAYDNTLALPSVHSKLIEVKPAGAAWSYNVHLVCTDAPKYLNGSDGDVSDDEGYFTHLNVDVDHQSSETRFDSSLAPSDHRSTNPPKNITIIYEAPSGVPGSIAFLTPRRPALPNNPFPVPRPPNNQTTENGANAFPGSWIRSLQETGKVGRVCFWDRPGVSQSWG